MTCEILWSRSAVRRVSLIGLLVSFSGCYDTPRDDESTGGSGGGAGIDASAGAAGNAGTSGVAGQAGSGGSATTDGGTAGSDAGTFSCTSSGSIAKMVVVPAGEFTMGCNAAIDSDCLEDEKPLHKVYVSVFQIDETEVTQDQFAACVLDGACDPPFCEWDCSAGDLPASCVTWDLAKMYCAWAGKRLPTEAEWEKAARGTDGRKYPWGNQEPTCERVNMSGCGEKTKPVGSQPLGSSPYGALDMAGNMVEMLSDWYAADYYASSPYEDPEGPAVGSRYVGRGGGFKSKPLWQRTSSRDWYDTYDQGNALGFRCAK